MTAHAGFTMRRVTYALVLGLVGCPSGVPPLTPAEVDSDLRDGGLQSLRMGACGLIGQYFKVDSVEDIVVTAKGTGRTGGTARARVTNRTVLNEARSCEVRVAFTYRYDGASWRLQEVKPVSSASDSRAAR